MSTSHALPALLRGWAVARRMGQTTFLLWARLSGYWRRAERRAQQFWIVDRVEAWMRASRDGASLIGWRQMLSFQKWAARHSRWVRDLEALAQDILQGKRLTHGQAVALDVDDLPWSGDWRGTRVSELSRLGFLLPLAQMTALEEQSKWRMHISRIAADWARNHPIGRSVGWAPTECALRGIHLAIVAQIMAVAPSMSGELVAPLLRLLSLHGRIVYHHAHEAGVSDNQRTARLVSLLIVGSCLLPGYAPARRWVRYAAARIDAEIERRLGGAASAAKGSLRDRRRAAEMLLLALATMERLGFGVEDRSREWLARACGAIGPREDESDDVQVGMLELRFDPYRDADRCLFHPLAAAYFDDPNMSAAVRRPSSSVPWLLGDWERDRGAGAPPAADKVGF